MQVINEQISERQFNNLIREGFVLVDFYADWCLPCRLLSPILEKISKDYKNVRFVKVNIENNRDLAEKFNVMSIPNVVLFKDGKEADRFIGFMQEDAIKEWIEKNI
ncbi:MAG: thioredoxin [Candidatus Pacearchaeota archaeon]